MNNAWQILLVEDDDHIRITLRTMLSQQGYLVTAVNNADAAFQVARDSKLDIVLLDLGLPDLDGTQLIPMLKKVNQAALIVISARDKEEQKVKALDAGADDYLTKPFGVSELLARMRSVVRRLSPAHTQDAIYSYQHEDLSINTQLCEAYLREKTVHITPVEWRLLTVLVRETGKIVTHRQLLREVWGPHHEEDGHYLRIYMRQLRRKLERDPTQPRYLLNEPGLGYRLATE
ncbi:response regulator [Agitococcus lubricus]|uniref:Two-component system KDP operon response regulator KdpE n=1 Tax=Agitococcus lubricus TaxID=1077255 RepID=A0A2T5IZ77_9GAMM|nr:response regulator [Agitococcus lubricus]PTQ89310.1 two-component system KDP operon response regulator KdpE [Agitococcus lubricus]